VRTDETIAIRPLASDAEQTARSHVFGLDTIGEETLHDVVAEADRSGEEIGVPRGAEALPGPPEAQVTVLARLEQSRQRRMAIAFDGERGHRSRLTRVE
jgi:hypothetical protein